MNTPSLLIVFLSVAFAAGMAIIAFRVLRSERRRSDARVAALAQMAAPDFLPEPAADLGLLSTEHEHSDRLFTEPEAPSRWGSRAAIAGGIGVLVLVVFMIALFRSPSSTNSDTTASARTDVAAAPLELLALTHTQASGSLTVSGRVQNPPGGQALESLTATVFLFGADGSFLTSGRSPLDVQPLGAGDESAFVVSIPVNGAVTRYRVSFRDGAGRAVAHADRRNGAAMVRNE
jgi:hypothetical protein